SSRRLHSNFSRDWSSDVCSSDLTDDDTHDTEIRIAEGGVFKTDIPENRQEHGRQETDEQPVDKGAQYSPSASSGGVSKHPGRRCTEERRVGKEEKYTYSL